MGQATPCLGYPSRTAAVVALRAEGVDTRQIARKVGIEPKTVSALEASASRYRNNSAPFLRRRPGEVTIDPDHVVRLRRHAAERGLAVSKLVHDLLECLLVDDLVDAILDDGLVG